MSQCRHIYIHNSAENYLTFLHNTRLTWSTSLQLQSILFREFCVSYVNWCPKWVTLRHLSSSTELSSISTINSTYLFHSAISNLHQLQSTTNAFWYNDPKCKAIVDSNPTCTILKSKFNSRYCCAHPVQIERLQNHGFGPSILGRAYHSYALRNSVQCTGNTANEYSGGQKEIKWLPVFCVCLVPKHSTVCVNTLGWM